MQKVEYYSKEAKSITPQEPYLLLADIILLRHKVWLLAYSWEYLE